MWRPGLFHWIVPCRNSSGRPPTRLQKPSIRSGLPRATHKGTQETLYFVVVSDFDADLLKETGGGGDASEEKPHFEFRGKRIEIPSSPPHRRYLLSMPKPGDDNVYVYHSDGTLTPLK